MNFKKMAVVAATSLMSLIGCVGDTSVEDKRDSERLGQGQAAADYFKAQYDSAMVSDSGRTFNVQRVIPYINESMSQKFNTRVVTVSGHTENDTSGVKLVVTAIDTSGNISTFLNGKLND